MTCREKLKMEHPDKVDAKSPGGCCGCPGSSDLKYIPGCSVVESGCYAHKNESRVCDETCRHCWDQEIPGTVDVKPFICAEPCATCGHYEVCMWKDAAKKAQKDILKLEKTLSKTPFSVKFTCTKKSK